ncbi:MAG: hypothetical protein RLZZ436_1460 [Planctomycetota bacterium]
MLTLLPPNTRIFCPNSVAALMNLPGQPPTPTPAAVQAGFLPECRALAAAADDADWLMFTACTDPELLRPLLTSPAASAKQSLSQVLCDQRSLIFASGSPLPEELQREHSAELLPFLHRPHPDDILLLPRHAVAASGQLNIADAVLQHHPLLEIHQREPNCSRTPGPTPVAPLLQRDAFRRSVQLMLSRTNRSRDDFSCIEAGLLLLHDFDDHSHTIVQALEGLGRLRTADCWHAIMHRREPDPGNAAWWFRRVSSHPAAAVPGRSLERWLQSIRASGVVQQRALQLLNSRQQVDGQRLIELAGEAALQPGSTADSTLRLVQYLEMVNLLTFPA